MELKVNYLSLFWSFQSFSLSTCWRLIPKQWQQIQFNDNGSFGGAATFTFDNTTNASNPVATLEGELIIGKDSSSTGPGAGIRVGANKDF